MTTQELTRNPLLPSPCDVLPINSDAILLDAVYEAGIDHATGVWVPTKEVCFLGNEEEGPHIVTAAFAAEAFNQLAAYVLMHGMRESKCPVLTSVDRMRWRRVIQAGDTVQVDISLEPRRRTGSEEYRAIGKLMLDGQLACSGRIEGVLLAGGEEWHEPESRPTGYDSQRYQRVYEKLSKGLYARIIDLSEIPEVETSQEAPKVKIVIKLDDTIEIENRVVRFRPHELFIFNALLKNLGSRITRNDLEELGFAPNSSSDSSRRQIYTVAKKGLREKLVAGSPPRELVIQKSGSASRMLQIQLDPGVRYDLYDQR